jgi:hypothetical protein
MIKYTCRIQAPQLLSGFFVSTSKIVQNGKIAKMHN